MPQKSPVSRKATAINAGWKVPKVVRPTTFRKKTTTSTPTGRSSTMRSRLSEMCAFWKLSHRA